MTVTAVAKLTAKGQTTVPADIRAGLGVAPGDHLLWEMAADGSAHVRRAQPLDVAYLQALEGTLQEWSSANDDEAYRDL